MQKQKKKRIFIISIFILAVTITTLLVYLSRIGLFHKINLLEISADKGDVYIGKIKTSDGFMTLAYFYKYQCESSILNFSYNCEITNGKCKLIIIDPSKEKIVASIDLNGEGNKDVEINKTGNYYVRLVREETSGDIELNAFGPNIVYNFTIHKDKIGLYDYN